MGRKAIIVLFCIATQLCAANIIYKQEKPTDKIRSAVMQPEIATNNEKTIVSLDDNSVWEIYPCSPKLYTYCDHFWETSLCQIDPRFRFVKEDWTGIKSVDIYNYPFKMSEASKIITPQFPQNTSHLLVNTDTNKIAFAYPLIEQFNPGYKAYGPNHHKDNFNSLIGGRLLKSRIKNFQHNPLMIIGPKGSGRKTLVRALAKEKNKVLIEVDLSVDHKNFISVVRKNPDAIVMFYGLSAKDELQNMLVGLIKGVANDFIKQTPNLNLSDTINQLTTYYDVQCFIIADDETASEFSRLAKFKMPTLTSEQRKKFLSHLLNGFDDLEEICELTEGCTFEDLKKIVQVAQSSGSKMSQKHLLEAGKKLSFVISFEEILPKFIDLKQWTESKYCIDDLFLADDIKSQLSMIANSVTNKRAYRALNITPSNTLLLTGPSGIGKTTAIEALARDSKRTLIYADGAKLWEDYLNEGFSTIENLLKFAAMTTPCILCIDGLDHYPMVQQQSIYDFIMTRFSREIKETQKLDDFFLVITANNLKSLHSEILKKCRTGFHIQMPSPKQAERMLIVEHFKNEISAETDCDVEKIANLTRGFSITDIKDLFIMAECFATQDNLSHIPYKMFESACKRLLHLKSQGSSDFNGLSIFDPLETVINFSDIGGCTQAKEDMEEIIAFLKNPKLYAQLGVRPPKGILLQGPPGCGKTLLAKAVAGEANCSFFYCSGSELQGYYVNENIVLIKQAFEQARNSAPAILFIDEIDAIGGKRSHEKSSSSTMYAHGVNQLLSEMDGFNTSDGVVVIGATNFAESLDPALVRPGRFDRKIAIDHPSLKERQEILEVHAKKRSLNAEIDMEYLARICIGMSGAELESMVNEAALSAAREQRTSVTLADLQNARDQVLLGRENKSWIITDEEKRNTAYHEAGHTVVGLYLKCTQVVDKVTITPRGFALGITWSVPEGEHACDFKSKLKGDLARKLGGYAAEKMFINDTTSGVSNDLKEANKLARRMICEWGMSDALGFLVDHKNASPETKRLVDKEVQNLLDEAYTKACMLLEDHRDVVEQIVDELLEKEMLYREDLDRIMAAHD